MFLLQILHCQEDNTRDTYVAPEVKAFRPSLTKAADIYSLGLVFLELWFRQPIAIIRKAQSNFKTPERSPVHKLMVMCLHMNPERRENIDTLLAYVSDQFE